MGNQWQLDLIFSYINSYHKQQTLIRADYKHHESTRKVGTKLISKILSYNKHPYIKEMEFVIILLS